jgi:hypothetical protein
MDRTQPRHVDRRDQGMRRQRRITQWSALGSAALIGIFGWVFAQPGTASAGNSPGNSPGTSTGGVQGGQPKKQAPATTPAPKRTRTATTPAQPAPTRTQPSRKTELQPPPAPPAQTETKQPDTRSGGS